MDERLREVERTWTDLSQTVAPLWAALTDITARTYGTSVDVTCNVVRRTGGRVAGVIPDTSSDRRRRGYLSVVKS